MLPSRIRAKLRAGETVITAKVNTWSSDVVEQVCAHGFDGIWFCLEHARVDPSVVTRMIQATRLSGADAFMRVKPGNYTDLLWLLEAGARGVMLPRVREVAEVSRVVEMMKFPPEGRRGYDGVQPEANFGLPAPADYMASANRENFLVVQIEEPAIVPHLDAVAAHPGVDVLFVGPSDLTLNLGIFGQVEDARIVAILEQVVAACRRHGKVAGIPCPPDQVARYHALGFRFINAISDFRCIAQGLKTTAETLRAAGLAFGRSRPPDLRPPTWRADLRVGRVIEHS